MDPSSKITITICGDGGTGKSSITLRLVRSQWTSDYDPTIEDSYSLTRSIDGHNYTLFLTDTAGQEEYRGMWAHSNLSSDAFLMVYDITNPESLVQLDEFNQLIDIEGETRMESAERERQLRSMDSKKSLRRRKSAKGKQGKWGMEDKRDAEPPIIKPVKIVAGNKCDLSENRQVSAKQGLEWARSRDCGFMETSARNVVNIEETFALIVRRVVQARIEALALTRPKDYGEGREERVAGVLGKGCESEAALFEAGLYVDHGALGNRNATRPLTPEGEKLTQEQMVASEREKWKSDAQRQRDVMSAKEKLRRFWGQVKSWAHHR